MKKLLAGILAMVLGTLALQAQKPALDHSVYDGWKSLGRPSVPYDGAWMYYTLSPQQGDGELHVVNAVTGAEWTCPRASDFKISLDGTKAVYKIKPSYEETRQARIKKKKADQMPKDSLAVLDLKTGAVVLNVLSVFIEPVDVVSDRNCTKATNLHNLFESAATLLLVVIKNLFHIHKMLKC